VADFEFKMSIANKLDQVWLVRAAVACILEELDFAEADVLHVQLALAEVINNCIEHSYAPQKRGCIEIRANLADTTLKLEIFDDGNPVPLRKVKELLKRPILAPAVDLPVPSSGRGLQIIRSTMDSVVFSHAGTRNKVLLRKTLRRFPPETKHLA
jgi:serine/threonine-protein kinase RsbW